MSLKMAAKETIKSPGCLKYVIFISMKEVVSSFTILPYSHYINFSFITCDDKKGNYLISLSPITSNFFVFIVWFATLRTTSQMLKAMPEINLCSQGRGVQINSSYLLFFLGLSVLIFNRF